MHALCHFPETWVTSKWQDAERVACAFLTLSPLGQFAEMRDIFIAYDVEHSGELNRARFTEAFMAAGALL